MRALDPVPRRSASETDTTFSTPPTCWITVSSGAVTDASSASGEAPVHVARTVSRGNSTSGMSSTGMRRKLHTPSANSAT